jgi:phytoene dehydrogenase-like protein
MRIFNDAPWVAPEGHTVVQSIVETDYDWWASLDSDGYAREKEAAIDAVVERMTHRLPTIEGKVKMRDISTPLTFWRWARSWRGAFEGYLPTPETFFDHVPKRIPGIEGLYRAGQWVAPGGGVPPALLSGRQVLEIICKDLDVGFVTTRPKR